MRNVGARRFPLGPITCFKILSLPSVFGSQVDTFLPLAVTMDFAFLTNSQAAASSILTFLASTVSSIVACTVSRTS